jgi:predicted alpha/beta superfamily hydrolase
MKHLLALLLLISANTVFSQKRVTDTISSQKLHEDREITIGLPPSYDKNTTQKYPVLVLLDGDFLFDPFQGALTYGNYWDDLPEMIVIGISQNKNNERESDCEVDATTGLPTGKGEKFFEFIGQELVPYIQKKYRTAPFKMIAGLDTTAGFLNFFLYKDDPLFDSYICLSPEFPKGMEEQIPDRLVAMKKPVFYYVSAAENDTQKMRTQILKLNSEIKKILVPKFHYRFEDYNGTSHYSAVLHAIPVSLYQIFSSYQPISVTEFQEKIAKLHEGYVDYLKNKYEKTEKTLGYKAQIRLTDFKAIEAAILKNKAYNEFDLLAQLANEQYPKTMLGEYHMARLYEGKGDIKRALRSYQMASQMLPIGDLDKEYMLGKVEELKGAIKQGINDPAQEIIETPPTETPKEEKKQ